jgi:hypothetical protein
MRKTDDDDENNKNNADDDNDCFYESLDRIVSSSCSCSNSNSDNDDNDAVSCASPNYGSVPKFPTAVSSSNKYDVWISEPSSVSERRSSLLRQLGLSNDPSLSRTRPTTRDFELGGDFGRSASSFPPPPPSFDRNQTGMIVSVKFCPLRLLFVLLQFFQFILLRFLL